MRSREIGALSPEQCRTHLLGIFLPRSPGAQDRRAAKALQEIIQKHVKE